MRHGSQFTSRDYEMDIKKDKERKSNWEKMDRVRNPEKYKAKTRMNTIKARLEKGIETDSDTGMAILKCVKCGTAFLATESSTKYCSNQCYKKARCERAKPRIRAKYLADPDKAKAYRRSRYHATKHLKGQPEIKCKICGVEHIRNSQRGAYCSAQCADDARKKRVRLDRDECGVLYVKHVLRITGSIPADIVEAKRAQIKLTRILRKTKKQNQEKQTK